MTIAKWLNFVKLKAKLGKNLSCSLANLGSDLNVNIARRCSAVLQQRHSQMIALIRELRMSVDDE